MLQFGVEFVAVVLEPILETFEQIGGEVSAVACGIAVGGDGFESVVQQRAVPRRRAGERAAFEPDGGPQAPLPVFLFFLQVPYFFL